MTETEKRTHRVCFTGHRPEKLTRNEKAIKKDLEIVTTGSTATSQWSL